MSYVVILLVVLLLLYGGDRLALFGKGLGAGVKSFKKVLRDAEQPPPPPPAPEVTTKRAEPKLLPAKGETTSNDEKPDPSGDGS